MEGLTLPGFLVLGLLTGLGHCTAMCGAFVVWLGAPRPADAGAGGEVGRTPWVRQLSFHLGRSLTYGLLGMAAGALGSAVGVGGELLGLRRAAMLVAGGLLLAFAGAGLLGMLPWGRLTAVGWVSRRVGRLLAGPPRHPFLLGLALGLLPCGPLYAGLLAAAGLGHWALGALAMLLFGLGTWPALLALGFAARWLTRARPVLHALALAWMLVMGALFVWRGIQM